MSKTAAARYTHGPTMTTDSLAVKPARPRDPDRQAPPTTVRSAQTHAVLRPRPGVTGPQITKSRLLPVPVTPAFGKWRPEGQHFRLQLRALTALPEGSGSDHSTHMVAHNLL